MVPTITFICPHCKEKIEIELTDFVHLSVSKDEYDDIIYEITCTECGKDFTYDPVMNEYKK